MMSAAVFVYLLVTGIAGVASIGALLDAGAGNAAEPDPDAGDRAGNSRRRMNISQSLPWHRGPPEWFVSRAERPLAAPPHAATADRAFGHWRHSGGGVTSFPMRARSV